jgi:hypothetical protein
VTKCDATVAQCSNHTSPFYTSRALREKKRKKEKKGKKENKEKRAQLEEKLVSPRLKRGKDAFNHAHLYFLLVLAFFFRKKFFFARLFFSELLSTLKGLMKFTQVWLLVVALCSVSASGFALCDVVR